MYLRELGKTGKIVIESRTSADNNRLYLAYSKIMLDGSAFMEAQEFQKRIEKLEFVDKKVQDVFKKIINDQAEDQKVRQHSHAGHGEQYDQHQCNSRQNKGLL